MRTTGPGAADLRDAETVTHNTRQYYYMLLFGVPEVRRSRYGRGS